MHSKLNQIWQYVTFCIFALLSGLLDGYERLCTACQYLAPVLAELEHEHLCRFSLTWEVLNKYLHQSIIYSDPIIQANVPIFISQVSWRRDLTSFAWKILHKYNLKPFHVGETIFSDVILGWKFVMIFRWTNFLFVQNRFFSQFANKKSR